MEILSDLKEKIKTSFPEGADVNYEVKYITKALQDYASPAMYFTPQIDNNAVKDWTEENIMAGRFENRALSFHSCITYRKS